MARRTVDLTRLLQRSTGGGGAPQPINPGMMRPQAGPATESPLVRNVYPPWVYKLPTSQDFNVNLFSTALAAVAGTVVEITSFTLPPTLVGWVQIFGIYILSPTALQDVTFALRINEAPVAGWDNLKFPPGVANFVVQNYSEVQVRIPNGATVDVTATNNAATGPWTVGAKISGWYHTEIEEQRIYGRL